MNTKDSEEWLKYKTILLFRLILFEKTGDLDLSIVFIPSEILLFNH
ncbi:MAG: hypothetical protein WBQ70_07435 [Flavobacterium sp.]